MSIHVTLNDGRTMELHLSTVGDQIDIVESDDKNVTRIERLKFYLELIGRRLVSKSWEGELHELTPTQLTEAVRQWLTATEDDAVPPGSGGSSATPRRGPSSRRRTAKGRRSGGQPSSSC